MYVCTFVSLSELSFTFSPQTVFYILPLLCDVTLEEVIPLKCFQVAVGVALNGGDHAHTSGTLAELLGVGLGCSNPGLRDALEAYWVSPPREEDGSATRSLAHHVSHTHNSILKAGEASFD